MWEGSIALAWERRWSAMPGRLVTVAGGGVRVEGEGGVRDRSGGGGERRAKGRR